MPQPFLRVKNLSPKITTNLSRPPEFATSVKIDGEPWFVAADACRALELDDVSKAVSRLDDDEKGITTIDTPGGEQSMLTVNEPGLYRLVFASRKPEAREFQRWVYHEVLPSIRKTGGYSVEREKFNVENSEAMKTFSICRPTT